MQENCGIVVSLSKQDILLPEWLSWEGGTTCPGLLDSICPWQGLCLGRLPPKKECLAKPKRVEARDLSVHNAKLWREYLKLILVGNLRLFREQRKGHLEIDPWDLEHPPGKVRVLLHGIDSGSEVQSQPEGYGLGGCEWKRTGS